MADAGLSYSQATARNTAAIQAATSVAQIVEIVKRARAEARERPDWPPMKGLTIFHGAMNRAYAMDADGPDTAWLEKEWMAATEEMGSPLSQAVMDAKRAQAPREESMRLFSIRLGTLFDRARSPGDLAGILADVRNADTSQMDLSFRVGALAGIFETAYELDPDDPITTEVRADLDRLTGGKAGRRAIERRVDQARPSGTS